MFTQYKTVLFFYADTAWTRNKNEHQTDCSHKMSSTSKAHSEHTTLFERLILISLNLLPIYFKIFSLLFPFIHSFRWCKLKSPIGIIPCEFKGGQSTIKLNLHSSLPAVYHDRWIYKTSAVHKHSQQLFFAYLQGV